MSTTPTRWKIFLLPGNRHRHWSTHIPINGVDTAPPTCAMRMIVAPLEDPLGSKSTFWKKLRPYGNHIEIARTVRKLPAPYAIFRYHRSEFGCPVAGCMFPVFKFAASVTLVLMCVCISPKLEYRGGWEITIDNLTDFANLYILLMYVYIIIMVIRVCSQQNNFDIYEYFMISITCLLTVLDCCKVISISGEEWTGSR